MRSWGPDGGDHFADAVGGARFGLSGPAGVPVIKRPVAAPGQEAVAPSLATPVRALFTMPAASRGVGMTCRSILAAGTAAGFRTDLHTTRNNGDPFSKGLAVRDALPGGLGRLPYSVLRPLISDMRLHRRYLASLGEGEIAYLWPSVPLPIYESVARRGNPIVVEAVNTRMKHAKPLLDAAYDALGLAPGHGITETRITSQEERYALATAVFTPSPATEEALKGTCLEHRFIRASYGTWVRPDTPLRARRGPGQDVTFLYVGTGCVRKGTHLLLSLWRTMPPDMRLRLVGDIEPDLARLFHDVLDRPNVSRAPFTTDVRGEYDRADVFVLPSLEEGDSIVTYEAAASALPILASPMGAGRIGAETGAVSPLDISDPAAIEAALAGFARDEDLRRFWGARARAAVQDFDWAKVGARRFVALHGFFAFRS
ncbi:MAG: glycosyltransferase family 4 protein [Paracoccaceae bacterium]